MRRITMINTGPVLSAHRAEAGIAEVDGKGPVSCVEDSIAKSVSPAVFFWGMGQAPAADGVSLEACAFVSVSADILAVAMQSAAANIRGDAVRTFGLSADEYLFRKASFGGVAALDLVPVLLKQRHCRRASRLVWWL